MRFIGMKIREHAITGLLLFRHARRVAIASAGCLIVIMGIVLLVLPGPGVLTIAAGLGLLSTEFECARRCVRWCRARGNSLSRYSQKTVWRNE